MLGSSPTQGLYALSSRQTVNELLLPPKVTNHETPECPNLTLFAVPHPPKKKRRGKIGSPSEGQISRLDPEKSKS